MNGELSTSNPAGGKAHHLGYVRALDGYRGVAIVLVLLFHAEVFKHYKSVGFVAVNSFFVLSGFLITTLLIAEWKKTGRIRLSHFYVRRGLRLLPALSLMLTAFLIFAFLVEPHKTAMGEFYEALRALFYFCNWAKIFEIGQNLCLVHTWSLSIEEQFYLLWPLTLLWLLRKNSQRSLLCWLGFGVFLSAFARVMLVVAGARNLAGLGEFFSDEVNRITLGTDTRADALLWGCLAGAAMSFNVLNLRQRWLKRILSAGPFAGILLLGLGNLPNFSRLVICLVWPLISLLALVVVLHLVLRPESFFTRIMENPVLVFLGRISYGLYLWDTPVLQIFIKHQWPWEHLRYLLLVFPIAIASYYLVEKPCLRLKRRFAEVT